MTTHLIDFNRLEVYEAGALLVTCWHTLTRAIKPKAMFTPRCAPMRSGSEAR